MHEGVAGFLRGKEIYELVEEQRVQGVEWSVDWLDQVSFGILEGEREGGYGNNKLCTYITNK